MVEMEQIPHQMLGYDRAITLFSPEGRLLQVEYAKKTVRQGSTVIGMVCKDGVLLVADKRLVDTLIVPEGVEKVFQIDEHIGAAASGIISDARVLVERAQLKAQQHRVAFDSPIDLLSVVKDVCNLKQICTQSAGLRPFGVSILFIGIDQDGLARLYETDPTGIFFQYKATAIGEAEPEAEEILKKKYSEDMTIKEGIKLAIKILKKTLGEISTERLDIAYIEKEDKKFKRPSRSQIERIFSETRKRI